VTLWRHFMARTPEIQRYVQLTRKVLRSIGGAVGDRLLQMGVEVAPAQGGFYVFPNFAPFRDALIARGLFPANRSATDSWKIRGLRSYRVEILAGTRRS